MEISKFPVYSVHFVYFFHSGLSNVPGAAVVYFCCFSAACVVYFRVDRVWMPHYIGQNGVKYLLMTHSFSIHICIDQIFNKVSYRSENLTNNFFWLQFIQNTNTICFPNFCSLKRGQIKKKLTNLVIINCLYFFDSTIF